MAQPIRVLGFAGSLRVRSYNGALLREVERLAPHDVAFTRFDLAAIPLYNADLERHGDPEGVAAFKAAIAAADALFIVTPEYQHGMPGVLKNALDWASRPAGKSPLRGKPAAIAGASPGQTGTARAQMQLRQTLDFSNVFVVPEPEVLVARVHEKVDADGAFTDATAEPFIVQVLTNLVALTRRLQYQPPA